MPTLKFKITVALTAKPAPRNAAAKLRLTTDPLSKAITHQDLLVWWSGYPPQSQISLQLDDEPEFFPDWIWENPGVTERAIVRIDGQFIPDDGLTHRLKVRIRELKDGAPWSPPAIVPVVGGVKHLPTAEQPAWCGATLIRQAGPDADALIEVQWRHQGAVKLMAKTEHSGTVELGYADADESAFMVEDLGAQLKTSAEQVTIGVCAIDGGQFGPPLWAVRPIELKWYFPPQIVEYNRDRLTRVAMSHYALNTYLVAQLRADPQTNVSNVLFIGETTLRRLLLKIKDIVRKGGRVEIDDFGRFEARWNPSRTVRGIAFVPSPGLVEGVRLGRTLTDAEAKGGA